MENLNFETALVEASYLVDKGWSFASEDIENTIIELKNIEGKIYFSEVNKLQHSCGFWNQSDFEHCGDDDAAWEAINELHAQGKLFDIVEEV